MMAARRSAIISPAMDAPIHTTALSRSCRAPRSPGPGRRSGWAGWHRGLARWAPRRSTALRWRSRRVPVLAACRGRHVLVRQPDHAAAGRGQRPLTSAAACRDRWGRCRRRGSRRRACRPRTRACGRGTPDGRGRSPGATRSSSRAWAPARRRHLDLDRILLGRPPPAPDEPAEVPCSTVMPGMSNALPRITLAVWADAGSLTSSSGVFGSSPPCRSTTAAPSPISELALFRKKPVESIISSSSARSAFA